MSVNTILPTDYQLHLFHEGSYFESYKLFGAHILRDNDRVCTRFCVWAPNAKEIKLVGDFNDWSGDGYPLHRINNEGVWMIQVDEDLLGSIYKYEITLPSGESFLKSDPYSFYSQLRPETASVVYSLDDYQWNDHQWRRRKEKKNILSEPVAIYEVHLGSWLKQKGKEKDDNGYLSYRELADHLIPHVLEHGFTHVEFLPLVEHPLDASWGYQGTGYFSATSRYGKPEDLMYLIDQFHQNGIGVILDWVPGHFCKDAHGLYKFDGTYLFEYQNEKDRENYVWGTANFDLGKNEVQSFLISNALYWMEYFHVDGFRVDAVSNIIYWPNTVVENPYGIAFLKKLNSIIFQQDPTMLMVAEDSTDWPQVTAPVHYGGLGFNYKWNMGWMNDFLKYMETDPNHRNRVHDKITFSLLYTYTENFCLPLSHDEVVHGKKSLLDKMPGDYWQKFAQFRLMLGYMFSHPGKNLLFMGFELAQFSEWKDKEQLDWHLLDYDMHKKANEFVKELLKFYKRSKPLYEKDHLHDGFEWIDVNNHEQSIFSFVRKGIKEEDFLVIICNFTYRAYENYKVGVPKEGTYREVLNSDMEEYGGSGVVNKKVIKAEPESYHGRPYSVSVSIPPYGISILRPVKQRKERKGNGKETVRSHVTSRRERK